MVWNPNNKKTNIQNEKDIYNSHNQHDLNIKSHSSMHYRTAIIPANRGDLFDFNINLN